LKIGNSSAAPHLPAIRPPGIPNAEPDSLLAKADGQCTGNLFFTHTNYRRCDKIFLISQQRFMLQFFYNKDSEGSFPAYR
jgi:hypothetical protein